MMSSSPVRVRIAPSPTGNLHVGTARTALFNYLFAKHHNGQFILRIEDTDKARSESKYTQNIYDGLKALGLCWDEGPDCGGDYGPYAQSDREELHTQYAHKLEADGLAYWDFTTPEELTKKREMAAAKKRPFIYRSDAPTTEQQKIADEQGLQPTLRFRIPSDRKTIIVTDIVRGEVSFDANLESDLVILKSDGAPAYNFACVVDDALMKISHVIRGEDHLPNTPKQVLLYEALGFDVPQFAHLGMILAPDRSKLSKRHGATAVDSFITEEGYLPEAFVNFLTLLGWATTDGEEIMTLDRVVELFDLSRVSHSGAIFDHEKLAWMNAQYITAMDNAELLERLTPFMDDVDLSIYTQEQQELLVAITKEPLTKLSDIQGDISYFFGDDVERDPQIVEDVLNTDDAKAILTYMINEWVSEADFSSLEAAQASVKVLTKHFKKDYKTKTVMWTLRASTTGRVQGADLASTLYLLGKERIQVRLHSANA